MASRSGEIWGTWEDLIVAKLVARDGPRWNIVAVELRARVSPAAAPNFTPQSCQQRFNELRRRFAPDDPDIDGGVFPRDIPWTDDLLLLRLEQLRRELENSGVPIGALGLKVDQLKEERERKLQEAAGSRELDLKAASIRSGARDSVSGENSQSKAGVEEAPDPAAAGDEKAASCNGSTETIAKGEAEATLPASAGVGRRRELADSAAQSKEGEGDKENSDVQSSASLSKGRRRKRRSKVAPGVGDAGQLSLPKDGASQPLIAFLEMIKSHDYGTELERVLLNQVMKFINEELGLVTILPSMWGSGNRCIINGEIRLNEAKFSKYVSSRISQEMVKYSSIVRRPVDMDMVRAKLAGGAYSSHEFCRDLLLLCTNAIVVFPKGSRECIAAVRLRNLVLIEMHSILEKLPPVSHLFTLALTARPKLVPEKESTQPLVPKIKLELGVKRPSQLNACKKRSSISAKPAVPLPVVFATESKVEKDEKPKPDGDRKDSDGDDEFLAKKLSGTRRVRTTKNRGRSSAAALKAPIIAPQLLSLPPAPALKLSPASGENRPTPLAKPQKKSSGATSGAGSSLAKKRGAATFLNRIKEKSPPPSSPPLLPSTNLLESLKGASSSGNAGKGQEMKKAGEKGEGKKELAPRSRPSGKAAAEKGGTVKRSVGRPPKRTAPPLTLPPAKRLKEEATVAPLPVKRVKEEVAATATPPPTKRVKEEVAATATPPPTKRVKDGEGGSSGKVTAATPPPIKRVKEGEGGSGSGSGPTSKVTAAAAAPTLVKRACPPPLKRVKEEVSAGAPPPVKRVCPPPQKRPREEVAAASAATAPPPAKRVCPPPVKRVKEEATAAPPPVMKVREEMAATVIPPPLKRVKEEAAAGPSKRGEGMSASKKKGRK